VPSISRPYLVKVVPPGPGRLPRVLRDDELDVLLDEPPAHLDEDPAEVRWRDAALLELLYGSGLRAAEVCGLTLGDVQLDTGRVVVWGKGSKQRHVPLSEPAVDALHTWIERGRALFPAPSPVPARATPPGPPIRPATVGSMLPGSDRTTICCR